MVQDIPFVDIQVGDRASITKTVTETEVNLFAQITGDVNPVHIDEEYARQTMFKGRVAHGMLTASFISTVLGTVLPGANSAYLKQELVFRGPVKIGETVTATVEVIEKIERRNWIVLHTTVQNQDGVVVVDGKATVIKK
jgi:3-hydroxybutyryl-CoA dehydratase